MINALLVLLSFQLAGEIITRTLRFPVPGPVVGMLLLFAALLLRGSWAAKIEPTTQFILKNLTLLYVPAAVGVVVHLELIKSEGVPIVFTLAGSILVTMAVTTGSMKVLLGVFQPLRKGGER
jgi:holin-like protein